jgi:hypothetical protein
MDTTDKLIREFMYFETIKQRVISSDIPIAINPPPRGAVFPGPSPGPFPGQTCDDNDSDEECKKKILKETEDRLKKSK